MRCKRCVLSCFPARAPVLPLELFQTVIWGGGAVGDVQRASVRVGEWVGEEIIGRLRSGFDGTKHPWVRISGFQ